MPWRLVGFAGLPKVAELIRRRQVACDAAVDAKKAEYAARPIDDEAWGQELQRRAELAARGFV